MWGRVMLCKLISCQHEMEWDEMTCIFVLSDYNIIPPEHSIGTEKCVLVILLCYSSAFLFSPVSRAHF